MHPVTITLTAPIADDTAVTTDWGTSEPSYIEVDGSTATDGVATLLTPARLNVVATDSTGVTFTITGTNSAGMALVETIAGGVGTVTGEQTFATVTSVYVDGIIDTVSIGVSDTASTLWVPLDTYMADFQVSFYGSIPSNSVIWQVDVTYDDVFGTWRSADIPFPRPVTPSALSGLSGPSNGVVNDSLGPVTAVRATLVNGDGLTTALDLIFIQQGY